MKNRGKSQTKNIILKALNQLLSMTIIFTMINLNIAVNIEQSKLNVSSYAYANESGDDTTTSEGNCGTSNDGTQIENCSDQDDESAQKARKEYTGTYNKEDADGGLFGEGINQILLLTGAWVLTKLFVTFQPSKPYDMWPAVIGGGIYLIGELQSAFSSNKKLDDMKGSISYEGLGEDGQIDQTQVQILEAEKAALEEVKDTGEKKLKIQRAAMAVFAVAAATAATTAVIIQTNDVACMASCLPTTALIKASMASDTAVGPSQPKYTFKLSELSGTKATIAAAATATVGTTCTAAETPCGLREKIILANYGIKIPTGTGNVPRPSGLKFYATLFLKLIPSAFAVETSMIAILLGLIGPHIFPVDYVFNDFIYNPWWRMTFWLGFSLLAESTAQETEAQVEAAEKNIKTLDDIINKFKAAAAVAKSTARNAEKKTINFGGYQPMDLGGEIECVGGLPKISSNNGTKACPSVVNGLTKVNETLTTGGFSLPDGLLGSMVTAGNGSQGVTSVSPATQAAYDNLAKNADALKSNALKAVKRAIAVSNKANGRKDTVKGLLGHLGKSLRDAGKKSGARGGGLMAALPGLMNQGKNKKEDEDKNDKVTGLTAKAKGGQGLDKKNPKDNEFSFDFGESKAEEVAAAKNAEFDQNADALANLEDENEGQVITDKSVDIWKVISTRYKKTAYDRLLKVIE